MTWVMTSPSTLKPPLWLSKQAASSMHRASVGLSPAPPHLLALWGQEEIEGSSLASDLQVEVWFPVPPGHTSSIAYWNEHRLLSQPF